MRNCRISEDLVVFAAAIARILTATLLQRQAPAESKDLHVDNAIKYVFVNARGLQQMLATQRALRRIESRSELPSHYNRMTANVWIAGSAVWRPTSEGRHPAYPQWASA